MKTIPVAAIDAEIASNRQLAARSAREFRYYKRTGSPELAHWFEGRYQAFKLCADSLAKTIELFSE